MPRLIRDPNRPPGFQAIWIPDDVALPEGAVVLATQIRNPVPQEEMAMLDGNANLPPQQAPNPPAVNILEEIGPRVQWAMPPRAQPETEEEAPLDEEEERETTKDHTAIKDSDGKYTLHLTDGSERLKLINAYEEGYKNGIYYKERGYGRPEDRSVHYKGLAGRINKECNRGQRDGYDKKPKTLITKE